MEKDKFAAVANSFSQQIVYNRQPLLAVIVPQLRKDGMHFEVNIKGYQRFQVKWSELGRYDIVETDVAIPYEIILAVSDMIEKRVTRRR